MSDGVREGTPGRVVLRDFVGGQRRAMQLEADRGWDSEGVGPALGGQGVAPWPFGTTHADGSIATPSGTVRAVSALLGDRIYVGIGRYLYRSVAVTAGSWGSLTQVADLGAGVTITALAYYRDKLAVCCGAARDIQVFDPGPATLSTLQAGEKGTHAAGYANCLIYSDVANGSQSELRMTTGGGIDTRALDSPVVRMSLHGGKVAVATRTSLYLLGGRPDPVAGVWLGDPEPVFTHGAWTDEGDFAALVSFGGRLYAWLANQVMEWNPRPAATGRAGGRPVSRGRPATARPSPALPRGRDPKPAGQRPALGLRRHRLVADRGGHPAGLADLPRRRRQPRPARPAARQHDLRPLPPRLPGRHEPRLPGGGQLHDLAARRGAADAVKAWRSIRASFAAPEERGNAASPGYVDLTLRYSLDGGRTWSTHVTDSVGVTAGRAYDLGGALAVTPPQSRYLQVEVEWDAVTDWAPVLTAIVVEYERLGDPAKRRRWQMSVTARDRTVERDGAVHTRTGREIVADVWAAWQTSSTVPLRDLDYDADPVERTVRIVGLVEEVPKPDGASTVALTLVEL
jgi:hypothetical protein